MEFNISVGDVLLLFLGAVLALPVGLEINRQWERIRNSTRRTEFLAALRLALAKNQKLILKIKEELDEGRIPTFGMDLMLLDSTNHEKYGLLRLSLCAQLDTVRYELAHLSRKLDQLFAMHCDPSMVWGGHIKKRDELRESLIKTIRDHLPALEATISNVKL